MSTVVKIGRNDPCVCGSGKKYKKCCALDLPPGPAANQPVLAESSATPPRPGSAPDLRHLFALMNTGRHAELETRAREVVVQHADAGVAWKLLGLALWRQGKDALPALENAARLLPDDAEAQVNVGNLLRRRGRLEDAAAFQRRAIEIAPDHAEAHNNLGSVLRDLGRRDEAVASYRRAVTIDPNYAMAHHNLGVTLQQLGQVEEALALHRRAIKLQPDSAENHGGMADALRGLGRPAEAVASYRRALVMNPRCAEVHCGLGAAQIVLGLTEEAAASFGRALDINPHYAEAHGNLGHSLRELGRPAEAVVSCSRALQLLPGNADVHNNLGNALFDLGRFDEAVQSFRRSLALAPSAKAYANLGSAYLELGKLNEAESNYRRSLELNPEAAEVLTNLAAVLRFQIRRVDAESACRKALSLKPDLPAALAFLAELRSDDGRFSEAESLYHDVIAVDPESPVAWAGLAALRKMTSSDQRWIGEAERIAETRLRPRKAVPLHYAIGKFFDDSGDFERAFVHYRQANELTKTMRLPHDRVRAAKSFDAMLELFDREWVEAALPGGVTSAKPVFVIGMPRSGTSLAEQILASHPEVFGGGELPYWGAAASRRAEPGSPGPRTDVSADAQGYLQLLDGYSAAPRVVDKMPGNFAYLGLIHAALPGARFIHMQRNPVDTCLSIYCQNFNLSHSYANDFDDLAHYYGNYLRVMARWRAVLPPGVILDVPYESLVGDPEKWSRRMVEFIGLEWNARCLAFEDTPRSVGTFSKWQVRQKISRTSVERWRNYAAHVEPLMPLIATGTVGG